MADPNPRKGVDVGGVPDQPLSGTPGPQRPAGPGGGQGGGQGGGKPRGPLAQAPEAQPTGGNAGAGAAGVPAPSSNRPANAPPVDTDAVGEPLPEAPPGGDQDQGGNRPSLRDLRDAAREPGGGEQKAGEGGPDSGEPRGGEQPSPQSGEPAAEKPGGEPAPGSAAPGSPAGAAPGEMAGAGGAGAGAGAAGAGGAGAAGAGPAGAEAAGAAVGASPVGWAAIIIAVVVVILALIFLLVIPGMSGSGSASQTAGNDGGAAGGGTVSGNVQKLAQDLLDSKNVEFPLDASSPNGSTKEVLKTIASGKAAPVTCRDSTYPGNPTTDISVKMLGALVDAAGQMHLGINALSDKCHDLSSSNHYKGIAVDFDCNTNYGQFAAVARKYGGVNNGETCSSTDHIHFDFPANSGGNSDKGRSTG